MVPFRFSAFVTPSLGTSWVDDAGRRPTIIANPPGDRQFRAMIDRYLLAGGREPSDLEATLRTRYPMALVRRRELAGESFEVWYVYRDGHWIGSEDHHGR